MGFVLSYVKHRKVQKELRIKMEEVETLTKADSIPIIKDITFWHLLATVSLGILLRITSKHFNRTEEILSRLVTNDAVKDVKLENHDDKLENHEKRLERLEHK